MKSTDDRKLFGTLIGASAATGNIATIPATQGTAGDGTASIALAFPPETFIARAAGGEPPRGADMNGFLNLLSSAMQVLQAGYLGPFDATFAAGIGGYPAGAIVSGSTAGTFWVSTADSNTTVPGATGATWQSLFNGYATEAWANGLFATITALNSEASTRASADDTLQSNISAEANARIAADALNAKLTGGNDFIGSQDIQGNLTLSRSSDASKALVGLGDGLTWLQHYSTAGAIDAYIALAPSAITTHLGTVAMTSELPTFTASLATSGYQKLPSGLIIQWGTITSTTAKVYNFPITFPTAALTIVPGNSDYMGNYADVAYAYVLSTSEFEAGTKATQNGNASSYSVSWVAFGY
ncbi:MAG: hypothetical protein ABF785_04650 [Acetobacter papayae]|uniref:gp53-like domain-containing protein n=1 Tax=Acetobacter papayae TaxID=1076592 RepID=UPI0039ECC557